MAWMAEMAGNGGVQSEFAIAASLQKWAKATPGRQNPANQAVNAFPIRQMLGNSTIYRIKGRSRWRGILGLEQMQIIANHWMKHCSFTYIWHILTFGGLNHKNVPFNKLAWCQIKYTMGLSHLWSLFSNFQLFCPANSTKRSTKWIC